ncbi:unnamed protein product, partial [Nesidiocoris tenuis]
MNRDMLDRPCLYNGSLERFQTMITNRFYGTIHFESSPNDRRSCNEGRRSSRRMSSLVRICVGIWAK